MELILSNTKCLFSFYTLNQPHFDWFSSVDIRPLDESHPQVIQKNIRTIFGYHITVFVREHDPLDWGRHIFPIIWSAGKWICSANMWINICLFTYRINFDCRHWTFQPIWWRPSLRNCFRCRDCVICILPITHSMIWMRVWWCVTHIRAFCFFRRVSLLTCVVWFTGIAEADWRPAATAEYCQMWIEECSRFWNIAE